jgi:apolipoprotein N-acyltransferase
VWDLLDFRLSSFPPFRRPDESGNLPALNLDLSKLDFRWRRGLAILFGVLFSLAFPAASVAGFAWLFPGLLLLVCRGANGRAAFQIGCLFGVSFSLCALYWMNYMPVTGFQVVGWIALSSYHALYYGLWTWGCGRLLHNVEGDPQRLGWIARLGWSLTAAALWVLLEFVIGRFLTGFPWLQVGVTQFKLTPLIQLASLTGVGGISFLVVWFSVSLGSALEGLAREPKERSLAWREVFLPLALVAVVFAWGSSRITGIDRAMAQSLRSYQVASVQPSVPQTLIWDDAATTNRFNRLLELSRDALRTKSDLLLWPEAAMPGFVRHERHIRERVQELVREHGVWLVCNGNDARYAEGAGPPAEPDYYNSAFLFSPEGEIAAQYDKRHLVIFGEYVPLARWLPFLKWFTPIGDGFASGNSAAQFPHFDAAVLICFEDAFAALARDAVKPDTAFLINLTNDGWFSHGPEQWQHAVNALFRAVETGRPLVRSANDGISCWIDPAGRVRDVFAGKGQKSAVGFPVEGSVYDEGILHMDVVLPRENINTFYWRHGDWFVLICAVLVGLSRARMRRRSA